MDVTCNFYWLSEANNYNSWLFWLFIASSYLALPLILTGFSFCNSWCHQVLSTLSFCPLHVSSSCGFSFMTSYCLFSFFSLLSFPTFPPFFASLRDPPPPHALLHERPSDLQQEHDRGHLPGPGGPVQRPQRAAGAAHAPPPRQGQPPGQWPPRHAHRAPHHLHHADQHLMRPFMRPLWSPLGAASGRAPPSVFTVWLPTITGSRCVCFSAASAAPFASPIVFPASAFQFDFVTCVFEGLYLSGWEVSISWITLNTFLPNFSII